MKTLIAIMIGALLATPVGARVGETRQQVQQRYGKHLSGATTHGHALLLYRHGEMQIGVVFLDGKSVAEFYSKSDKSSLSEGEIKILLEANSFNGTWSRNAGAPMWTLEPGGMNAVFDGRTLTICTPEFLAASKGDREREETAKLKDF